MNRADFHLVIWYINGKKGSLFWFGLNSTDPRLHLAVLFLFQCKKYLYRMMSELWPCASLHLPERGRGEKAANKQKRVLELLLLASPSYSFWSSCAKNVRNSECPLFIYLCVKYFSFPSGSDRNQCLMTHLRYSKTTRRGKRARELKKRREMVCVCVTLCACAVLCVCVSLSVHVRTMCVCVCVCKHTPSEDGADVHSVASLAHCSKCHKKKKERRGFSPLCFKFHRPSKWAQTLSLNK